MLTLITGPHVLPWPNSPIDFTKPLPHVDHATATTITARGPREPRVPIMMQPQRGEHYCKPQGSRSDNYNGGDSEAVRVTAMTMNVWGWDIIVVYCRYYMYPVQHIFLLS